MLHFLPSMLRGLKVAIMTKKAPKTKRSFSSQTVELISLSYLSLSVPSPYHSGQIWPAPRVLVYPAFDYSWGDLLFFHPFLIVPKIPMSAGMGFTISTKSSNSPSPGSYLCCPLLQKQIDPTMWTDEMNVGQAWTALPIQIKLKNPSSFHTQNNIPSSLRDDDYHKFLKKQGLLISYFSPYNKFKIHIKVNFKIRVTK
jgi:hypothetical protein